VQAWNNTSSVWSSNALLSVEADTVAPLLTGASAVSSNQILVSFSELLDVASATNLANYALTNGSGVDLPIYSAVVTNGTNVMLTVGPGAGNKPYVVVLKNIKDASAVGNSIRLNSAARLGLQISIPLTSVWKYDASGLDLGTAWRNTDYDDSSWLEGAGLLYHTSAALPAEKNTLLPLNSPVTGAFNTNFYFRYSFSLPTGTTNASIILRHVIDDGVLIHANGREFHRFNMAAGSVTPTTFANVSVVDAAFSGPFQTILTNFVSGKNVLAAEVHQITPTSSDICFGAEIIILAPSLVIIPPVIPQPPPLTLTRTSGQIRINWTGTGFTLQRAASLNGTNTLWQNITGTSPHLVAPTSGAGFYRLRN
jgi:hypothetical protein